MRTKIIKLISLILSLLMLFTMIPLSVSAEGKPKTILDVAQNDGNGNYYLTGKVTVTATATGTFTGTLDGNGYTVTTSVPLFEAVNGATIQNLTVEGNVTGFAAVATLVYGSGAQTTFNKVINKASVTNTVALKDGNITAYDLSKVKYVTAAGLASFVLSTTANFIDCVNEGSIKAELSGNHSPAAGIVGYASGATVNIKNCLNSGNITASQSAAGIIALINNPKSTNIEQCINSVSGIITCPKYTGGIVGRMQGSGNVSVTRCGNKAKISGTQNLGGIVGHSDGENINLSVHYCYNVGEVSGSDTEGTCVAGIVGRMDYSATKIGGCYNNGKITGTEIGQLYWGTSNDTDIGENYYNSAISATAYYSYTEKAGNNNATSFTAEELASGALALKMNEKIGKTVYYQNINDKTTSTYPVTDPTHGYVFENGGKLYSLAFFTLKTASIRLDEVNHGIRFSTAVNKTDYAVLTNAGIELTFGTLITPDDYLEVAGYDFTKDKLDKLEFENSDAKAYLDVTAGAFIENLRGEDNDTYYYFCGSITGIKEGNYDWDYSAIGYITVGNSTVYSCQYATRNAAYVANAALNDTAAGYTDAEKVILGRYLLQD